MRLIYPLTQTARATLRALHVISDLERDGCTVVEAHAHTGRTAIRVDRRPTWIDTYGYRPPPAGTVRQPVVCVAEHRGARIEWISKERNQ